MDTITAGAGTYPAPMGSNVMFTGKGQRPSYSGLAKNSRALAKKMREEASQQEAAAGGRR